jgi:fructose-1,6-bisphosphatase/inositol monophosphatase family enzyme
MQEQEAAALFAAVDQLGRDMGKLVTVVDSIANDEDRRMLRRAFAEASVLIEEKFIYEVCRKYPELRSVRDG